MIQDRTSIHLRKSRHIPHQDCYLHAVSDSRIWIGEVIADPDAAKRTLRIGLKGEPYVIEAGSMNIKGADFF